MGTILELETINSNSLKVRKSEMDTLKAAKQVVYKLSASRLGRPTNVYSFHQGHSFSPQWMDCIKHANFSMLSLLPVFSYAPEGQINFKFLQSLICGSFISLSQTLGPN